MFADSIWTCLFCSCSGFLFVTGKPAKVRFHVWVLGIDSIDEGSMVSTLIWTAPIIIVFTFTFFLKTYVADIFMSQSWKDNRLVIPENISFNVNTSSDPRGPYRLLPVTLINKIWRPDSFFKNAKEVTFQEMTIPNHYIWWVRILRENVGFTVRLCARIEMNNSRGFWGWMASENLINSQQVSQCQSSR